MMIIVLFTGVLEGAATGLDSTDTKNDDLEKLNIEEREILDELFLLSQDVKDLQIQSSVLNDEISELEDSIINLDESIAEKQIAYDDGLSAMEEVLVNYQRRGPVSYLQLILSSGSIKTLVERINGLRDLSRGTSSLLSKLEEEKLVLVAEKEKLDESVLLLTRKRNDLEKSLELRKASVRDLEARLDSLQDERSRFEDYLAQLQQSMEDIKPIFSQTMSMLSSDIEKVNLSEDLISLQISFAGVKGTIMDEKLNLELQSKAYPTTVEIEFRKGSMVLEMPEIDFSMEGNLEQLNDTTLAFKMTTGEYMGFTLEQAAMEQLFSSGLFELKLAALLGRNTIRSVELQDGYLVLNIKTALF